MRAIVGSPRFGFLWFGLFAMQSKWRVIPSSESFGLFRPVASRNCDLRIGDKKAPGRFLASMFGHVFEALFHMGRAPLRVMGIGGHEMDPIALQHLVGESLC